jgi:hypothetical protein
MTDEAQTTVPDDKQETSEEFVEFVGWPPYGTQFSGGHSIDRKHMKDVHDIDLGAKEVSWTKGANGRFLVPTSQFNDATLAYLKTDPAFRVVSK